jgi:outer membrane scaffolding protein for murein synthesis (MipA/OmpV family)
LNIFKAAIMLFHSRKQSSNAVIPLGVQPIKNRVGGRQAICTAFILLLPAVASAGKILDAIRSYDLNNYALGVHVSVSQNPYTDAKNSIIVYPYLTSFENRAFTKDWLLLSDGDLGVRKVTKSDWVFGFVSRIQTLGLGSERSDDLLGLEEKQWTIEAGPLFGYRGWPIHLEAKMYKEISGRHGGWIGEFRLEYPVHRSWGYIVPAIKASLLDDTYSNHYFQVTPQESDPNRPVYIPGSTTNLSAEVVWGYRISDKWLLSGKLAYTKLGDEIVNSPIVDKDSLWSGGIGLAYNANVFRAREFDDDAYRMPRFEFRAGLFQNTIDTKITLEAPDGGPGEEIDLEDILDASDTKSVLQLDAIVRLNSFHRLEFGYFDLARDSSLTLTRDIEFGDEIFLAGTNVSMRSNVRVARVSYAFSLMHDAQKELGFMAGIHVSRLETEIFAPDTGQREGSTATTPLPVIGVHGSIALGTKTFLGMRVQIFRMHFDHYEGSMNYVTAGLQHMLTDKASLGLGYNFYDLKLDSDHSALKGTLEIRHHGPFLFLGVHF